MFCHEAKKGDAGFPHIAFKKYGTGIFTINRLSGTKSRVPIFVQSNIAACFANFINEIPDVIQSVKGKLSYSDLLTVTLRVAVTSGWSFTAAVNSPRCLIGSARIIFLRSISIP